jgi:hypothetical protein
MIEDAGLAPNPFGVWCTLALCTPNHQHTSAREKGDWIAGFFGKKHELAHKLVYAMELFEKEIQMDDYYQRPDFQYKKPKENGTAIEQVGDNIYFKNNGELGVHGGWNPHAGNEKADIKYGIVFVAKKFWYFGKEAVDIPEKLRALIPNGRGTRINHDRELVKEFREWVENGCGNGIKPGKHGDPLNFVSTGTESLACPGICNKTGTTQLNPQKIGC